MQGSDRMSFDGLDLTTIKATELIKAIQNARRSYVWGRSFNRAYLYSGSDIDKGALTAGFTYCTYNGFRAIKLGCRKSNYINLADISDHNAPRILYEILNGSGGDGQHSFKCLLLCSLLNRQIDSNADAKALVNAAIESLKEITDDVHELSPMSPSSSKSPN